MRTAPLVSVITIFLNADRFLEEAIESVIAQTYDDWELVLVDDGSTDRSTRIAQAYAARFPSRIRYVEHPRHENRGMSASRNLGVEVARGELIGLLDADDVYLPHHLEQHVALLDGRPDVDFVFGNTKFWYSWGDAPSPESNRIRTLGFRPGTTVKPQEAVPLLVRERVRTPPTCSVLIRMEAVQRAGGFEDSFRGTYEDQVFFYKLFHTATAYFHEGCVALYRQHADSWCALERSSLAAGRAIGFAPSRRTFLEWLEAFLRRAGTPRLRRKITRELWPHRYPWYVPLWTALAPFRNLRHKVNRRIRYIRSRPRGR